MVEFTKPRVYGFCNQEDNNVKGDKDCMGSKTKSWLALALVVAMLFGMAVPTAFAAPVNVRATNPINGMAYTDDLEDEPINIPADGEVITGAVVGTALEYYLGVQKDEEDGDFVDEERFMLDANGGRDFTVELANTNAANFSASFDKEDGLLTITPIKSTTSATTITVTVKGLNPDNENFRDVYGDSKIFEGKFKVSYAKAVTATPKTVTIYTSGTGKTTANVKLSADANLVLPGLTDDAQGYKFTLSNVKNEDAVTDPSTLASFPVELSHIPAEDSKEQTLTIGFNNAFATKAFEGDLTIYYVDNDDDPSFTVGGAAPQPVTIHVKLVNADAKGYRVNVTPSEFNGRRDTVGTIASPMTFTMNVSDQYGTQKAPGGTSGAATIGVSTADVVFKKADGTLDEDSFTIEPTTGVANQYALVPALQPDGSTIKSWEGTMIFVPNKDYENDDDDIEAQVLAAAPVVVPVSIKGLEMTTAAGRQEFDKASTTVIAKDIQMSIVGGGTFLLSNTEFKAYKLDGNAIDNVFVGTHQGNGAWKVSADPTILKSSGVTSGYFTFKNAYSAAVKNGTTAVDMNLVKVYFDVIDTTPKAEVTVTPSGKVVLDLNKPTTDIAKNVVLSPTTGTGAVTIGACKPSVDGFVQTNFPATATIRFTGEKIGTVVYTVTGTIGTGVTAVPFTKDIEVQVVDSTAGKPNALNVTPDSVELSVLGSKTFDLTATALDAAGAALASPGGTFKAELYTARGATHSADSVVKHASPEAEDADWAISTTGKFTFERKDIADKADVIFYLKDSNNADIVPPVVVHITVGTSKLMVTPSEKMDLDLTTNKSAVVTIRNEKGTTLDLTGYNVTLEESKLADGTAGAIAKITNNYDASFTVTAEKAGTAKLKAVGTVANVAATPVYIALTVTEKPVVEVQLSVEVPELRVGGTAKVSYQLLPTGTVFDADSVEYILPAGLEVATIEGDTLTGVKEGEGTVTVKGTIAGVVYEKEATFTVLPKTATIGTLNYLNIDGDKARAGIANVTPLFVDAQACVSGGYDENGNPVVLTGIGKTAHGATLNDLSAKIVKNRSVTNKVFAADIREGVLYYKAKAAGYWMVELETNKGSYEFYFKNTNTPATKVDAPSSFTLHAGERIDLRSVVTVTPANANKATLKYKVQNNGVLRVTTTGILLANKAGTGKVQILNYKKTKTLATITVNVDTSYTGIKFASAYLFQDQNSDETKVAEILSAANFGTTPAAPAYKVLATSAVGLNAELTQLATQMTGVMARDDIFTFYFSGTVAQKGIAFADGTIITFDELATIAGKLPCQVFMIFDCSYSGSFISKGAIQNSLFKAVAKANASYAKTVGAAGNGKAKLHVLLATDTATGTIPTLAKEGQKALTSAFVKALSRGTDGNLAMGGTKVTMDQLYSEVKKTATNAGMYPLVQNGDAYPIYAIQPLPANP